jgi:branched-chain amino acid transport system permease protein
MRVLDLARRGRLYVSHRLPVRSVAVTLIVVAALLPWIVDAYTISVASYALVVAVLALSCQLLTNVAGLATIGQAAYLGVGAYTAAIIARALTPSGPVQLLSAAAVAALVAAVVGLAVCRTRAMAFLLCTLAVGELAHTAAENVAAVTGGGNGLSTTPVIALPWLEPLARDGHVYLYNLVVAAVLVVAMTILQRSRFGLIMRGIADHEPRMRANGHPADRHLWCTYVMAGALAGAAGAMLIATRRFVSPSDLGFDISALALLAAIIGGRGILVTCAAAGAIIAVRDIAGNVLLGYSPALLGALFIASALVRAGRLTGVPRRLLGGGA